MYAVTPTPYLQHGTARTCVVSLHNHLFTPPVLLNLHTHFIAKKFKGRNKKSQSC